ncbi:MAG: hypothetical protein PF692_15660 [Kiritimatiellae bacterium]|jgi:hypothetical protein|nr:hypothetical protein [Kiritimatiellia bacterium]
MNTNVKNNEIGIPDIQFNNCIVNRFTGIAVLTIVFILFSVCIYAQEPNKKKNHTSIKPHIEAQELLLSLVSSNNVEFLAVDTKEELQEKLNSFSRLLSDDGPEIMRQLLFFRQTSKDARSPLIVGIIMRELSMSKDDITCGLLPVLECTNMVDVSIAENWLGEVHAYNENGSADFSTYKRLLEKHKIQAKPGFIRYLYNVSLQDGAKLLSEHFFSDNEELKDVKKRIELQNISDLVALSKKDKWWLDVYVVEVLKEKPQKINVELIRHLKASTNSYVLSTTQGLVTQKWETIP